ncbi:ribbon-helix-helix domain-containing protein [Massilia soli]|uniref:Type II toxin-antitoxin system ParD family antitoxin n=1 Tax=Massilia soli TaxID=2792854 RepID=A0ABS7SMU9_9BURK|nr:type II toxin-antitoxin system ParD family antitoxin [Massilia soli]MBZ2206475.1 type II toxin-antitoxin system ParD family antitoxin [Massilia soli]
MGTTQQFSITLTDEMADAVQAKVATGEYATASDVIHDGLRVLLAREHFLDDWLHDQAAPAYDAIKADPSRAVSIGCVRERIIAEDAAARKK